MKLLKYCVLFFILVLFSIGCAQKPKEQKLATINIAFQDWVGYGPFYLAQEKGFCQEEGIELIFINEQLDSARRDAFKAGMLDCEAGTIDLLVSKTAQGTPIVAVMEMDESFGADAIVAAKNIEKLEDLIGKRVVLSRDDVGETFISSLLYKQNLPLDRIIIVPRDTEEVAGSFLNNEADVCVTWEPQVSAALQRPGAHILTSSRDHPGIIIDTLNVRRDLLSNKPQLVKGLMHAWFKALKYYQDNPLNASEVIAKYYDITPEEYRRQVQGLKWVGYEEQRGSSIYKEWLNIFNTIAEIKFKNSRIMQKPEAQKVLDHTFLERLYEDSK